MIQDLPTGWSAVLLDEVNNPTSPIGYGVLKPGPQVPDGVIMLRVKDVRDRIIDTSEAYRISRDLDLEFKRSRIQPGDVVISVQGSVGRVAVVPESLVSANISRTLARIRPVSRTLSEWICMYLESREAQEDMGALIGGTTRDSLNIRDLRNLAVPLAPAAEQTRVLRRVNDLLRQVTGARDRLVKVPRILKRFRQSVLAAACSGRLTEEWRVAHPDLPSGAEVLAEVHAVRSERNLPSAKRVIDDQDIDLPEQELPESWTWCRVGQVADVRLGGTPSRSEASYWSGEIPWVSSGEVANCRINDTAERITKKGLENSNAKLYPAGTVLIAMIGEGKTRGQSAILDIEACTNQNAAGLVFDGGVVNPEYIWFWALGEYEKNRDVGRGGNQPALNGAKVRALPLPLPPVEEQTAIVERVRGLLSVIDELESRVTLATRSAERLPQAILAKAFSGQLVPTEAELARAEGRDYEHASELLARITSKSATSAPARRGRRRGKAG